MVVYCYNRILSCAIIIAILSAVAVTGGQFGDLGDNLYVDVYENAIPYCFKWI